MKLILNVAFILIMVLLFLEYSALPTLSQIPKLKIAPIKLFGIGPTILVNSHLYRSIHRKQKERRLRNEEFLREREEEKRRKILNEHLMPLTKGNTFMKDFYSGRF